MRNKNIDIFMSTFPPVGDPAAEPRTLTDRAASVIAESLLSGETPPGARLNVLELSRRHGIGATPVREALSRLISSGLIVASGQKGFRAAAISAEDLVDIVRLRETIELDALRLAMRKGDASWEADILHALHLLQRYQDQNRGQTFLSADSLHKRFHTALIAACGSRRMIEMHSVLYDQGYRYRRLLLGTLRPEDSVADNHRLLAEKAIERSDEAIAILREQLRKPLEAMFPEAVKELDH
jgi:DNA-binding GntR family transcriptional regulator